MTGFRPAGNAVERVFQPWERALLGDLCGDLASLLRAAEQAPDDPAVRRLLPNAYPGDRESAEEFSAFARPRLTQLKVEAAKAILEDLEQEDTVRLASDRVPLWLRGLTDLRLVLAERIAVHPDPTLGEISDWLGWVLSDLLEALDEPPSVAMSDLSE